VKAFFRNWRFLALLFVFIFSFSILIFRSYQLQIAPESRVEQVAHGQFGRELKIIPRRASILDRNGRSLVMSVNTRSVFLDPYIIKNPSMVASRLSSVLGVDSRKIKALILKNKKRRFVWLKRQVSDEVEKKIQTLDLRGVGLIPEFRRHYVSGKLASTVLGFVSGDGRGLSGVESTYNELLAGERNTVQIKRDARGRPLFESVSSVSAYNGWKSLILTLDIDLQYSVEKFLGEAIELHKAKSGVAIVMDPENGEILALADLPNFNPNKVELYPASNRRVKSISDPIEPGSVLKIFGVGEALDRNLVSIESMIETPEKTVRVSGKTIRDAEVSHERTRWSVSDLVKFSSNVAMVKLGQKLGSRALEDVYNRVGFSDKTGIDLPGESRGIFNKWPDSKKLEWATMSFGQGIALTPMQIVTAYAMLANGGHRVVPRVLKEVHEGDKIENFESQRVSPRTSLWKRETLKEVKTLLHLVVQSDGTGKNAMTPEYQAAGKTGTSQKVDLKNGGYKADSYLSSFVGFAPVESPRVVVYVMINEPSEKFYYGGTVAAPVFAKIARRALRTASIRNAR